MRTVKTIPADALSPPGDHKIAGCYFALTVYFFIKVLYKSVKNALQVAATLGPYIFKIISRIRKSRETIPLNIS